MNRCRARGAAARERRRTRAAQARRGAEMGGWAAAETDRNRSPSASARIDIHDASSLRAFSSCRSVARMRSSAAILRSLLIALLCPAAALIAEGRIRSWPVAAPGTGLATAPRGHCSVRVAFGERAFGLAAACSGCVDGEKAAIEKRKAGGIDGSLSPRRCSAAGPGPCAEVESGAADQ